MLAPDVTAVLFRLTPTSPEGQLCLDETECGSGGRKGGFLEKLASNSQCGVTVKRNIESVVQSVSEDKLSTILHVQNKISPTHF